MYATPNQNASKCLESFGIVWKCLEKLGIVWKCFSKNSTLFVFRQITLYILHL